MSIMGSDQSKLRTEPVKASTTAFEATEAGEGSAASTATSIEPTQSSEVLPESAVEERPSEVQATETGQNASSEEVGTAVEPTVQAPAKVVSVSVDEVINVATADEPVDPLSTTGADAKTTQDEPTASSPPSTKNTTAAAAETAAETPAAPAEAQVEAGTASTSTLAAVALTSSAVEDVAGGEAAAPVYTSEGDDDQVFVPPDMEHIVSTGASESAGQSMDSLRDAVREAREAAGMPREALPPGFEDDVDQAEERTSVDAPTSAAVEADKEDDDDDDQIDTLEDAVRKVKEKAGMKGPKEGEDGPSSDDESSSSSDDSDSDSDDEDDAREVGLALGVDGDDYDDETGAGGSGDTSATKNEVIAPEVELPAIQVLSPDELAHLRPLGQVHSIVDSVVVIAQDVTRKEGAESGVGGGASTNANAKGKQALRGAPVDATGRTGAENEDEYSVLDTGSLLCFDDGKVLGLVFETFGSVHAPLYSIRYPSAASIDRDVVRVCRAVHYLPNASTYVLTRVLKAMKGSDASNIYDEEVGEDEIDYSDDEAEAEAKRRIKEGKRARQQQDPNGTNDRGNSKRQRGNNNNKKQQSSQEGGSLAGQPRSTLPPRPRPAAPLPARPNFDLDAPPNGGLTILSYDDASTGGDAGSGSNGSAIAAVRLSSSTVPAPLGRGQQQQQQHGGSALSHGTAAGSRGRGRGIAGLPPKPASLPQSPHSTTSSPALPHGSPAFNATPPLLASTTGRFDSPSGSSSAGGPASHAPNAPQHYPRTFGQHVAPPMPPQGSFPPMPPADGAGGHYNPRFAGYWAQQPSYGQGYGGYPTAPMYPAGGHYTPQHQYMPAAPPAAAGGPPGASGPQQHQQQMQQQHPGSGPLYYGGYGQPYGAGYPAAGQGGYTPAYGGYGGGGGEAYAYPSSADPNSPHVSAYPSTNGAGGVAEPGTGPGAAAGAGTANGSYDPKRPSYPGQTASAPSGYAQPPQQ